MPNARSHISQLHTSALRLSLAKTFAEIRSKIVPSVSWFGVVTKMAYGPGKTGMRPTYCQQLFTEVTVLFK